MPQEMTDHTGAFIWKAKYKAWGECKAEKAKSNFFENSEIISNNIRFQGQYFDQETGLHYNRYRYYSPYVGRFISKDPIGLLGGHNVYAYAPNPVEWVDPLGLNSKKTPAQFTADRARFELGKTSGAAADLQVGNVNITGISGRVGKNVHPQLKKALRDVPKEEQAPWHGACAEVDAINKALKKGMNIEGATIDVVNINSNDKRHGTHKPACSSYSNVLKQFGVKSNEK
nr:RHS repeat-associated core domain-containing protein [Acinetobacter baumannii]